MTPSRVVTGTLSERLELIFDRPGFRQMEASMLPLRLLLIVPLVLASPSLAQGTKQGTINRSQHVTTGFAHAGGHPAQQQPISKSDRSGRAPRCLREPQPEQ